MKKALLSIFLIVFNLVSYAQIFPEPSGNSSSYSSIKKVISKCDGYAFNIPFEYKFNTDARRYSYNIALWNECYQVLGNKPSCTGMTTCHDCNACDSGWKKIGRITFIRDNNYDRHKLNLGWRPDPNNIYQLKFSAYFHEYFVDEYVSHYLANVNTNTAPYVDMFMSLETIALIVNDRAIVIRKPGMIPSAKDSQIHNTFFFGDNDKCVVHNSMAIEFRNRESDKSGFKTKLDNCKYITINLSVFKSNDIHTFYAYEDIYGSIGNVDDVQTNKANYKKQQCEIPNGADISFVAGDKIYLFPGFHAKAGCVFEARIEKKLKFIGYYEMPEILNLPSLDQQESCINKTDSILFFKSSADIDLNSPTEFALFPNPNIGIFNIVTDSDQIFDVKVLNSIGISIFNREENKNSLEIDISSQPRGIYLVLIRSKKNTLIKKIVYN